MPLFDDNSKKISYRDFSKEQQYEIKKTNNYFYHKLGKATSCLNPKKWKEDFKQSRKLKKNICTFPTINFQKTKQIKLEREKSFNEKKYSNTAINFYNNKFKKTNFKNTKMYKPAKSKTENQIDVNNEHFSGGETVVKDENKEINLIFIIEEKRFNVKCKTNDFFIEVIDKFCSDYNIDNGEIEEYIKKGEKDGKEYIDRCDSVENNNLKNNDEIIAVVRNKQRS